MEAYDRLNIGGDEYIIFNEIYDLDGFFDDDIQAGLVEKFVIIVKKDDERSGHNNGKNYFKKKGRTSCCFKLHKIRVNGSPRKSVRLS